MNLYLAAPWASRDTLPAIATQFEAAGHTIIERWWEHADVDFANPRNIPELEDIATRDFMGVVQADVLVVINSALSEGKAVEMGIAIARFIPIILVGTRTNIFHFIPSVYPVRDVRAALRKLA